MKRYMLSVVLVAIAFPCTHARAQEGCALNFDGTNDRVTVPYDASFPTEIFTVAVWIKLPEPGHRAAIIARGEDDNSWDLTWQLYVRPEGTLQLMVENAQMQNSCYPEVCFGNDITAGCTMIGNALVADDGWHHVAATRNATGLLIIYIDGDAMAQCAAIIVPSSDNAQDLTIGCTHGTIGPPPGGEEPPTWFYPGLIDEAAMWNTALTDGQILELYTNGVDVRSPGLVGFWDFTEGSDQAVTDQSPAENHGFRGAIDTADSADPEWVAGKGCGAAVGDLNNDGVVDAADLATVLGSWGPCRGCPADFNGDRVVDAADLAIVLGNWT